VVPRYRAHPAGMDVMSAFVYGTRVP
jgi:hypothetical protein